MKGDVFGPDIFKLDLHCIGLDGPCEYQYSLCYMKRERC